MITTETMNKMTTITIIIIENHNNKNYNRNKNSFLSCLTFQ